MHWCYVIDMYTIERRLGHEIRNALLPLWLHNLTHQELQVRGEKVLWCPLSVVNTLMLYMSEPSFVILSHKVFG